jgi:hypothetical protein
MIQKLMEVIIDILKFNKPYIIKDIDGYKTLNGQYFMNQQWADNRYKMLNNLSNMSEQGYMLEELYDYLDLYMKADKSYQLAKSEMHIRKHLLWEKLNSIYKSIYNEPLETYKD